LFFNAGLVSAAFGIESGSDKTLELMNKGITSALIKKINKNFFNSGIATEWMTFSFHPGEKNLDAIKTINLINREYKHISLFIAGEFGLTAGSEVFRNKKKFFIDKIYFACGDEFMLYPMFKMKKGYGDFDYEKIDSKVYKTAEKFALSHYPWAGAISTHHSFLYFLKFRQNAFKISAENPEIIKKNIAEFLNDYLSDALSPVKNSAPLSGADLKKALEKTGLLKSSNL
jgi:anaerobic magnesium-protoporphyrin IX monomethyl ester cyclase